MLNNIFCNCQVLFPPREDGGDTSAICDVRPVLEQAVATFNSNLAPSQQPVLLEIQGQRNVQAPGGMVLSVINNLLRNAREHGGGAVHVTLTASYLRVADAGAGIAPASAAHVFERHARDSHSDGLGLGLFIVKRICERLDWQVLLHTAPGAGTCFEVRFIKPTET